VSLNSLHITNIVLIERLDITLDKNLTALTGETGAGKSILLDSLGLVTGARADANLIRKGESQASVTASFEGDECAQAYALLREQGFACDDSEPLTLRRVLGADGKSRAFINDQAVSVSLLRQIGELLVDIHGQFETYGLLDPAQHGLILDSYAGLDAPCLDLAQKWQSWREARDIYEAAQKDIETARREEDYLRHAVEDLAKLEPRTGEEAELLSLRQKIQHKAHIVEAISTIDELIAGEEGMERQLAQVWRQLQKLGDRLGADAVAPVHDTLDHVTKYLNQASKEIGALLNEDEAEYHSLEDIDDRLHELRAQARRHNVLCDDLPRVLEDLRQKLDLMDHQDARLTQLEQNVVSAKKVWEQVAQKISDARVKAAKKLDQFVNAELPPLKLEKAKFHAVVKKRDDEAAWGPRGWDHIVFEVSTNGGDFGALNKVASGGEMARFMLALKLVLAESQKDMKTYVFDEIDTGIGGGTAAAVGERLARLAQKCQVLVVTHSPQVAATAQNHMSVSKDSGQTSVKLLDTPHRIEEIARMLAGKTITDEARAAAKTLLGGDKPRQDHAA
jgi:DNA repair protein RecN (Recombination protein N)